MGGLRACQKATRTKNVRDLIYRKNSPQLHLMNESDLLALWAVTNGLLKNGHSPSPSFSLTGNKQE